MGTQVNMTYRLKIKNNTITLPRDLALVLNNTQLSVRRYRGKIILEAVPPPAKKSAKRLLLDMAGMLKGSKLPDASLWQKKIRKEWDRTLV